MNKFRIIIFLMLLQGVAVAQKDESILLKNATIIDGDANIKPYRGFLLIKDGYIQSVTTTAPKVTSVKVIDCTGKFITPGLMDAHVHLATADLTDFKKARLSTDSITGNMLRHGITTVRDMAGNALYLANYKKDVQSGKVLGPDVFYAAQFAGPGYFAMMGNGRKGEEDLGHTAWYRAISNKSDVKPAIADAKKAGVTGIKYMPA